MMRSSYIPLYGFLAGLGSNLFVTTFFGRVAMFDLVSFIVAPILYVKEYSRYSRREQRLLFMALLWLLGSVISNVWRGEFWLVALKGNAIIFNVWCMLVVGIAMVKRDYRSWIWFTIGNGLSSVISLYYFQNGALLSYAQRAGYIGTGGMQLFLVEKQVVPLYMRVIVNSVLLPVTVFLNMPLILLIVIISAASFYMLFEGGSRSSFGTSFLNAFFALGYGYLRRALRFVLSHFVMFATFGLLVSLLTFGVYRHLALSGRLGEVEYNKYMAQMVDSEKGVLGGRDDIYRAWPFLWRSPLIGAGTSARDRWGYCPGSYTLPAHSALVGSWVKEGFLGLIFWLYAIVLIINLVQYRVLRLRRLGLFVVFRSLSMLWAILFSPFGGYRGEVAVLLALCVVSYDQGWIHHTEQQLLKFEQRPFFVKKRKKV